MFYINMRSQGKVLTKAADPEMTTSAKLEQIKSGAKNKRSTGGAEKKNIVKTGKDGSKIIMQEKEEKFEETAVLRKKKNYVMYEAKLGTEKTTDITKIDAPQPKPKPKPVREPEPRVEEKIVQVKKKKEYLDNYQYHETKNIKNPNPRYHVVVEHQRLGDIIGGTYEETSYQRQVFSQGSNRPQLTEKTTTVTATGTANPKLRGNKSQATAMTKTVTTAAPQTTTTKRTTTTTTTTNKSEKTPVAATAKNEKITETTTRRRNEGATSKTETKTETKTTTSGTRGGQTESSTTTKTTTRTTYQKPAESKSTQQTTNTKTTTTRTTKDGDGDAKIETKTETKTESTEGEATGGSSIRKKYAKGRFQHSKQ